MVRPLVEKYRVSVPVELAEFLGCPPLLGDETLEEYQKFFFAIAKTVKPADPVDWLDLQRFVDIAWEIRREYQIKVEIIKLAQKAIILARLKSTAEPPGALEAAAYRIFDAAADADRWANDDDARKAIDDKLSLSGHSSPAILAQAYIDAAPHIEAVERRITSYEMRKMLLLREIERRQKGRLARDLDSAASDLIEGEFAEAAE